MIPPEADAEFVAGMEEVLDTYAEPVNPAVPTVCMDEQPTQLLTETRTPIPATKDHPKRVDYEYDRAGTASVFVFCEPKTGWRQVTVRDRRTKVDWAREVAALLRTRYAKSEKVRPCPQSCVSLGNGLFPNLCPLRRLTHGRVTIGQG